MFRQVLALQRLLLQRMQARLHCRAFTGSRAGLRTDCVPPSHSIFANPCHNGRHSGAARQLLTSAAAGGSGSPAGGSTGYTEWRAAWMRFLQQVYSQGHYAADPGITEDMLTSNTGAMKRAVLSLARQRGDILHSLDSGKLQALVRAGFPVDDRKTKNAHRRLQASILEGKDLGPADGGPAEMQDLLRVFISLAGCDQRDADMFRPLMDASVALLPDIMEAAQQEPKQAVQGTQRYMPQKREPGELAAAKAANQRAARSGSRRQPPWQQQQREQQEGGSSEGRGGQEGQQRWYDGTRRSTGGGSGRGRGGGRGGAPGRGSGGRGGRGSGAGRGSDGRGSNFQQRGPRPGGSSRQQDGSSNEMRWWDGSDK